MRDASTAVCVVGLLALAAAASDAGPVALSSTAALTSAWVAFHLLATLPSMRAPRWGHAVLALAGAAPFLWALELAARPGLAWPLAALGVAAGTTSIALLAGVRLRRVLAGFVAMSMVAVPLVDGLSVAAAPDWLRLPTSPLPIDLAPADVTGARPLPFDASAHAVRAGALVPRAVADAMGLRSRLVDAPWVEVPRDAVGTLAPRTILVHLVAPAARRRVEGAYVVVASPDLPRDARDLDATDVVLLRQPIATDLAGARALASFVRRGGLLVGPATPESFGAEIERALGAALPIEDGARGARALGAGHVARVARADGLDELVAAGLAEPPFRTAFDRGSALPENPTGGAERAPRRLSGRSLLLLAAFGLAMGFASRGTARIAAVAAVLLSGIAIAALSLLEPPAPEAQAEAFVLDLGGAGGRRVEVLRVVAGPEGWRLSSPLRSDGGLRVVGFRPSRTSDGDALVLAPDAVGWIVEELPGTGDSDGLTALPTPPDWSISLLRRGAGRAPDVRMFGGQSAFRGALPAGVVRPNLARTFVLLPGRS